MDDPTKSQEVFIPNSSLSVDQMKVNCRCVNYDSAGNKLIIHSDAPIMAGKTCNLTLKLEGEQTVELKGKILSSAQIGNENKFEMCMKINPEENQKKELLSYFGPPEEKIINLFQNFVPKTKGLKNRSF